MPKRDPCTPTVSARDVACLWAESDFRVIPLRDKRPFLRDWANRASSDLSEIASWGWEGENIGVGLPTGSVNRALVVDGDVKDGAADTREVLAEQIGHELPPTLEVRTPGGGLHLYYRLAEGEVVPKRKLYSADGQIIGDIQGDGAQVRVWPGYRVLPTSAVRHPRDAAMRPEWLMARAPTLPCVTGGVDRIDVGSLDDRSMLEAVAALCGDIEHRGPDDYWAVCPNPDHADHDPSLHIFRASRTTGNLLAHCMSRCGYIGREGALAQVSLIGDRAWDDYGKVHASGASSKRLGELGVTGYAAYC
jgi:hypothetical protein